MSDSTSSVNFRIEDCHEAVVRYLEAMATDRHGVELLDFHAEHISSVASHAGPDDEVTFFDDTLQVQAFSTGSVNFLLTKSHYATPTNRLERVFAFVGPVERDQVVRMTVLFAGTIPVPSEVSKDHMSA